MTCRVMQKIFDDLLRQFRDEECVTRILIIDVGRRTPGAAETARLSSIHCFTEKIVSRHEAVGLFAAYLCLSGPSSGTRRGIACLGELLQPADVPTRRPFLFQACSFGVAHVDGT